MITLNSFLIVSALIFVLGLLAILTKRNAISILMGVELILNAANINFVAFSHFTDANINGVMIALFVFVIAVSEAAVALAPQTNRAHNPAGRGTPTYPVG